MQFIHLVDGAFSKELCNYLIDFFEKNTNLAKPGGAGNIGKLNNLEMCLDIDFENPAFGLEKVLDIMLYEYKQKFPLIDTHIGKWRIFPACQFAKFEPNKYYSHIHCENATTEPRISNRCLAWMIYLNDIKEGGGTHFIHQDFTTKPVAGNLYIWPAGWTHMHVGVNAPYESKYTITGWAEYI